jgi:predicted HTH transcriptional regulator
MEDQSVVLADLLETVAEWLRQGDGTVREAVRHWEAVQEGAITPDTRAPRTIPPVYHAIPARERQAVAVRVATELGSVQSGELAQRLGVATETARRDLQALAAAGTLASEGRTRGRVYRLAEGAR